MWLKLPNLYLGHLTYVIKRDVFLNMTCVCASFSTSKTQTVTYMQTLQIIPIKDAVLMINFSPLKMAKIVKLLRSIALDPLITCFAFLLWILLVYLFSIYIVFYYSICIVLFIQSFLIASYCMTVYAQWYCKRNVDSYRKLKDFCNVML